MFSELEVIFKVVPEYAAEFGPPTVILLDTTAFTVFPRASVRPGFLAIAIE